MFMLFGIVPTLVMSLQLNLVKNRLGGYVHYNKKFYFTQVLPMH